MSEEYLEQSSKVVKSLDLAGTPAMKEDYIKLVMLTCNVTKIARKKQPEALPYHVLVKAAGAPDMEYSTQMYHQISTTCEVMLVNSEVFPDFGLKPKEMLVEIKRILDDWIPF